MTEIRVLIVEDEPIIAEDIATFLESMDYTIVGKAYTPKRALDLLSLRNIDLVLLDVNLGSNIDGIELAGLINQDYRIPFIYLTSYADHSTLDRAKKTFPSGYIVKPFNQKDLYTSIEIAIFNYNQRKMPGVSPTSIHARLGAKLTEQEEKIIWNIYEGKTNKQMADQNFVSINTIKFHIKKIYEKLDVHNRAEALIKLRNIILS